MKYLSLVRPHLEYCCHVWNPHFEKDKRALESAQKFACKIASASWDDSYNDLYMNASSKTEELNGLSTFHPPRVEVGAKCVSGDHIFQKFRHFLEDTSYTIFIAFL